MALLVPTPFATLIRRMIHEWRAADAIFDLPAKKWWRPTTAERARTAVHFHGRPAATPFGPAAGPHDQMAQNIVLSYLVGGRVMELKTVQILDELEIGRPCIDAATVGFNIEWSQELKLEEAAEEYVKAAMLVRMLQHLGATNGEGAGREAAAGRGGAPLDPIVEDATIYDISVGYDLKGIQSDPVRAFMHTMLDATEAVERLRAEIPGECGELRDLDFPTRLSSSVTLSTFHGCPPDEIERICEHLIGDYGLHTVVKMNPTMLGRERVEYLVREKLGYADIQPRVAAFSAGLQFADGIEMCRRLQSLARRVGVGFGAKFTNTLETDSPPEPLLPDKVRYLSGRPLHVVSSELMHKFRTAFGEPMTATFSAGLEKRNVGETIASGVVPATSCTDMLKTGGYARMAEYPAALIAAQEAAGAADWASWLFAARGAGEDAVAATAAWGLAAGDVDTSSIAALESIVSSADPAAAFASAWREQCAGHVAPTSPMARLVERLRYELEMRNSAAYVATLADDPHYGFDKNKRNPPKVDSHLVTFDCLACDKCIPVCPNDANYFYEVAPEPETIDAGKLRVTTNDGGAASFTREAGRPFAVEKQHQIANFADWCNECGNCDTFCPEYDGPYIMKPSFYGSRLAWVADPAHDGFAAWRDAAGDHLVGRMRGEAFALWQCDDEATMESRAEYIFAARGWIAGLTAAGEAISVSAAASADSALLDALWGAPISADPAAEAASAPIHDRMSWVRIARALADGAASFAAGRRRLDATPAQSEADDTLPAETLDLWVFHCARKLLEGSLAESRVTPTTVATLSSL
jgi:putative selenate reductase